MRTFQDTEGRQWTLAVTHASIKRVRAMTGVDLAELSVDSAKKPEDQLFARLVGDPMLLVDVVFALCQPQAEQRGVSDAQFGEAMAGDVIDQATRALLGDLVDFIPSPRERARAAKLLAATNGMIDRANDLMDATLDAELATIESEVLRTIGGSSTSGPASSASTPAP